MFYIQTIYCQVLNKLLCCALCLNHWCMLSTNVKLFNLHNNHRGTNYFYYPFARENYLLLIWGQGAGLWNWFLVHPSQAMNQPNMSLLHLLFTEHSSPPSHCPAILSGLSSFVHLLPVSQIKFLHPGTAGFPCSGKPNLCTVGSSFLGVTLTLQHFYPRSGSASNPWSIIEVKKIIVKYQSVWLNETPGSETQRCHKAIELLQVRLPSWWMCIGNSYEN